MAYTAGSQFSLPAFSRQGTTISESSLAQPTKIFFAGVALALIASLSSATAAVCIDDFSLYEVFHGGAGTIITRTETELEDEGIVKESGGNRTGASGKDTATGLDDSLSPWKAHWVMGNLQHIVEELKEHNDDGIDRVQQVEITSDTTDGDAHDALQEMNHFLNRPGLIVGRYSSGCPRAYVKSTLESFYWPQSLLEPSGLRAYFDFHIAVVEATNEWREHMSEDFQVSQQLIDGIGLARLFAASYEIVVAEALSASEYLGRAKRLESQFSEDVLQNQSFGLYLSRLRQVLWKTDAVFGEASSAARTPACRCGSLLCWWTCGMNNAFAASTDSLIALMTQVVSIFETIQGLLETTARMQCFAGKNPSAFEHHEAKEAFEHHGRVLSISVAEFQRLVKETGDGLLQLYGKLEECTSLVSHRQ